MGKESSAGDFVAGFLLGGVFGAVIALLLTPVSGQEMRDQLREKSIELKERADELGVEATKRAEELRAKGQVLFESQKLRFQEAIEEGKRAASQKKEELLAQLESTKSADRGLELSKKES
jgi:gas vesicle protein